jgi:hypothetical protein
MDIANWMSWEGGVDLVAMTNGATQPNVIVHVARTVHTPVGSAPSGMILFQPDPNAPPELMGFISTDEKVGAYFGPHIFAGTPFESAPVLKASIDVRETEAEVSAVINVAGRRIESSMSGIGPVQSIARKASAMPPFDQMVLEACVARTSLEIDGKRIEITVPPIGITSGPAATWAPTGIYCRPSI